MAAVIGRAILRTQTDERLVVLSRAGHQRAFEAIAERYRAELTRSVHRFLPSASVEDVIQQTHLEAWKALSGGTEVRELRSWLHRIARNAAIAVASRGYDYDELKDALQVAPGPEEELERRESIRRALRGIAELPERQRDALLAVAVGGRSHAEVAFELGITDTATRQLVRRARASLQTISTVIAPSPLLLWAARAGHTVAGAGHTVVAGKAAAGAGLGGGLTAPALKVGAVALAVGGVAAGVAPIQHAIAPSQPTVRHHHRHHASAPRPPAVLAATTKPSGPGRGGRATAPANRSPSAKRHHPRHPSQVTAALIGKTVPVGSPVPAASSATPVSAAGATITAAAAPPVSDGLAALLAWAIAHSTSPGAGASTASSSGWSVGQATPGASGQGQSPQAAPPAGGSGPCTTATQTSPSQTQASGSTAGGSSTGCSSPGTSSPGTSQWSYLSQYFAAQKKTN